MIDVPLKWIGTAMTVTEPNLKTLKNIRTFYMLPRDPLAEEVLIPGFRIAGKVDCMVSFFSSKVLASLAPGLATYVARDKNRLRLIISPLLSSEDQLAIENGLKSPDEITSEILEELTITEDLLQHHTLRCLSWLLRKGRIEIKVALMKNALFHPKVWLLEDNENTIAVHGSANATLSGISENIEHMGVAKSWKNSDENYITCDLRDQFNDFWENRGQNCLVINIPDAVRQNLLRNYSSKIPPTENELRELYDQAIVPPKKSKFSSTFKIPDGLEFEKGPFEHQGKAVTSWCDAGYHGVLEMATGSGKTITSMIGAHRLWKESKPLLIVITAPYVPLIEQWCNEIRSFGLNPVDLSAIRNVKKRTSQLQKLKRRVNHKLSDAEVVVVSHDMICDPKFLAVIETFNCTRLLIADEVHNLGRPSFINKPPEFFEYRLGLSATPIRQYDEKGTEALFGFFGTVVFRFTLEEAVGRCLVEYDYYVHKVILSGDEMDEWFDLTGKIKQNYWRNDDGKPDEYLAKLMRDRRKLLETASGKIAKLDELLNKEDSWNLKHTLIYTSDKEPGQLISVNKLLQDRNFLFHQLTAEETRDRGKVNQVIKSFQSGDTQILTAKRVLDEGVNIPQICRAFILASTTVERQWVQRRGRLLRTCTDIGKTYSVIHDLIVLPPRMEKHVDPDARSLVHSELDRVKEFAKIARNYGRPDGPLPIIQEMYEALFL